MAHSIVSLAITFTPSYFVPAASELLAQPETFRIYDCQDFLHVEFIGDTPKTFLLPEYAVIQKIGAWWARKFTANDN